MLDHFETKEGYVDFNWNGDDGYVVIHKRKWQPKGDSAAEPVTMKFKVSAITEIQYRAPGLIHRCAVDFIINNMRYKDSYGDEESSALCTFRRLDWSRLKRILEQIYSLFTCKGMVKRISAYDYQGYKILLALREDL